MTLPKFLESDYPEVQLKYEPDGVKSVLLVLLNRPKYSNALSRVMIKSLCDILQHGDQSSHVRAIVLTGVGKNFCSGGDIKAMAAKTDIFAGEPDQLRLGYEFGIQQIPKLIETMQTPLIASVNGAAVGAGLDLACMCDLRVAASDAVFGETFTRLGLIAGDGGGFFLQRVVGYAKAMELTLTARKFSASEAHQISLVHQVVEPGSLQQESLRLASQIAENAPVAVSLAKKALRSAYRQSHLEHLDMCAAYQGIAQRTEDHFEGLQALADKRSARFLGR